MKENLKIGASITSKVFLRWVLIVTSGTLITLSIFFISLYLNTHLAGGGHGSIVALVINLFMTNFFAFLLIFGAPIFMMLYFMIANKASIQYIVYLLWKNKAGEVISKKVGFLVSKLTDKEGWRENMTNKALLKAKILQASKSDPNTSRLQRKIIGYGLKRIKLDDINFQNEELKVSIIIQTKFQDFVSNTAKPSFKLFWIIVFIQLVIFILSLIL